MEKLDKGNRGAARDEEQHRMFYSLASYLPETSLTLIKEKVPQKDMKMQLRSSSSGTTWPEDKIHRGQTSSHLTWLSKPEAGLALWNSGQDTPLDSKALFL
ncbi:hypothetical protein STEG23_015967 [Scotinomys teguina]